MTLRLRKAGLAFDDYFTSFGGKYYFNAPQVHLTRGLGRDVSCSERARAPRSARVLALFTVCFAGDGRVATTFAANRRPRRKCVRERHFVTSADGSRRVESNVGDSCE
ncbi:unnamed protein product [Leptosia nina]|uniref:Uncharacterized protein n=1 Tax=Leptosia nina TaxID=320188 RepID=A0AAV1JUY9_9NEOP